MKKLLLLTALCFSLFALSACDDIPLNGVNTGGDLPGSADPETAAIVTAEDGFAEGRMGDVMRTAFFDFTVDSAYTCTELDTYIPSEGNQLLVADISIKNTSTYSMPMFDTDFQAQWGGTGDEDYSLPVTDPVVDSQAPESYEIPIDGTVTYTHVFEVPADSKDFSISFQEYYENGETGDVFFVYFTAEDGSAA